MVVEPLIHAGPRSANRLVDMATPTAGALVRLEPGLGLFVALHKAANLLGYDAATADLWSGTFHPLSYCVPADGTGEKAVSFSEPRSATNAELVVGSAVVGNRHGEKFCHLHCAWNDGAGRLNAGHVFPETIIGEPAPWAWLTGMPAVDWESDDDPETCMPTFTPHPIEIPTGVAMSELTQGRAVVARVLPNEFLDDAIVELCRRHGIRDCYVRGATGSLIGAEFVGEGDEPRRIDGPATEVATLVGAVQDGVLGPLAAVLVDKHGTATGGVLVPGANRVAVTLELVLQEIH